MANASCEHECRSARLGCRGDDDHESLLTHPGGPTAVDKREPSSVAFLGYPVHTASGVCRAQQVGSCQWTRRLRQHGMTWS